MSKKFKIIIFSIVLIGIIGITGFNYVMTGGARNLSEEKTDFTVTSKSVSEEFTKDVNKSNKKYLEKAIAIAGVITAINAKEVTIGNSIICSLTTPNSSIKKDQTVTIKGRVVGYDDLMGELKLDQCLVIKN
jgi:hypothetical protein